MTEQPKNIYVWLVPSEEVQEQPGSWRIRKWDITPFPEANYTLGGEAEQPVAWRKCADTADGPDQCKGVHFIKSEAIRGGEVCVTALWQGEFYEVRFKVPPLNPDSCQYVPPSVTSSSPAPGKS